MSRPIKEKIITTEEVKEWLKLAQLDKLNIFYDRNAIIAWLCRALLKEREKKED